MIQTYEHVVELAVYSFLAEFRNVAIIQRGAIENRAEKTGTKNKAKKNKNISRKTGLEKNARKKGLKIIKFY